MKFATAKEHRDFFQKNGWIEFDQLLSVEFLAKAKDAIDSVLAERSGVAQEKLRFLSPETIFLQGRDLWRSDSFLQKMVAQARLVEIAAELIEKKPLRLGYDQLIPTFQPLSAQRTAYDAFFSKSATLASVSCLSEVAGGLIWALDGNEQQEGDVQKDGIDIFPNVAGNAIFFKPDVPINWSHLYHHGKQRFYLIAYVLMGSRYVLQPEDPNTHALKRLGYVFNDKLTDRLHPIVYR